MTGRRTDLFIPLICLPLTGRMQISCMQENKITPSGKPPIIEALVPSVEADMEELIASGTCWTHPIIPIT